MDYALLENVILGVKILAAVITGLFLASLFSQDMRRRMKKRYRSSKDFYSEKALSNTDRKFAYDEVEEKRLGRGIK